YDLVFLRAHEGGVEAMAEQSEQILAGTHLHQRALTSLIEDGSYHARLAREIAEFRENPHVPARPLPPGLLDDPYLMLAMDQFKDFRGYARSPSRLHVGFFKAMGAWLLVAYDESIGYLFGATLGSKRVRVEACDPDLQTHWLSPFS